MTATISKQLAHQLRLFGIHAHLERRALEAESSGLHPCEFLALLLEDEAQYRKQMVAKRLKSRAGFGREAELEEWDQSFDRGLPKANLRELATLGFYEEKRNLILLGRTGEGKTHLAIAIGNRLCASGIPVAFHTTSLLFEEIAAARAAGKYLSLVEATAKVGALILDDFGLRTYTHAEATTLLDILESRTGKGVTIVTSQVAVQGWIKLVEDRVVAEALVDRLSKPSAEIVLKGGSYRDRLGGKPKASA
jgi:DNA replication protein DnaC